MERACDSRSVDGLGDRVAILGVSLWATISALASAVGGYNLPVWLTRRIHGRGRLGGGTFRGKMEALDHSRGGPTGPPLFAWLCPDFLALKDDIGDREDHDHRGDEPSQLGPDQKEALRGRQWRAEQCALDLTVQNRTQGTGRGLQ